MATTSKTPIAHPAREGRHFTSFHIEKHVESSRNEARREEFTPTSEVV